MNEHEFNKLLKKDEKYFQKQIEKGVEKLAGKRTKENVRNCFHCKLWRKSDKFIKEVLNLGGKRR